MRKDYILDTSNSNEIEFQEEFWTDLWKNKTIKALDLTGSDEWQVIKPYFDLLPKNAKILDVGCGTGEWTCWLSEQGYDLTGLDISKWTIDKLKEMFPRKKFVNGNILNLNFPDNSFDAIISWGVFEHFEAGLQEPLKQAWRVLKPGGTLMISTPYNNIRHVMKDVCGMEKVAEVFGDDRNNIKPVRFYQWRLSKSEMNREFDLSGFELQTVKSIYLSSGVGRFLITDLHLKPESFWYKSAYKAMFIMAPLFRPISHMILAIGKKKDCSS